MTDLIFNGKITISSDKRDEFLRSFNDLLASNNLQFNGTVNAYEFDDCEIIEDEENSN